METLEKEFSILKTLKKKIRKTEDLEELREITVEVMKLQMDMMSNIAAYEVMDYFMLLNLRLEDEKFKLACEMDEELPKTVVFINNLFCNMEGYKDTEKRFMDGMVQKIESLVKNLRSNLYVLKAYDRELKFLYKIIEYNYKLKELESKEVEMDLPVFYKRVKDYILQDKNYAASRIREILSVLPVKMTNKLFSDYIRTSLINNFWKSGRVDTLLSVMRVVRENVFFEDIIGYSEKFPRIYSEINNIKEQDFENLSKYKLSLEKKKINRLIKYLNYLMFLYELSILVLNRFVVVFENLPQLKLMHLRIWYLTICEAIAKKSSFRALRKDFRRLNKELQEKWDRFFLKYSELVNELTNMESFGEILKSEDMEQMASKLLKYSILLEDVVFSDIEEDLSNTEIYYDGYSGLLFEIEDFIDYMGWHLDNVNKKYKRMKMREIMLNLPLAYGNVNEFMDFIKRSLEFDTSYIEKKYIISSINSILSN